MGALIKKGGEVLGVPMYLGKHRRGRLGPPNSPKSVPHAGSPCITFWADARLSCSYCNYTLLFALTATKAPRRAAEVLGGPLAPQGTPSARTAEETKRNGRFRAALVARCRHMWAGRPLGGLRASAAAVCPLPAPHRSWALPGTPPNYPSRRNPHPLRLPASGAPAVTCAERPKSEFGDRPQQPDKTYLPELAH